MLKSGLPLGGSLVTFTEFCSTDTGKDLSGMELKKSLKSLWMAASEEENPLITPSIRSIHDAAKWQFYNEEKERKKRNKKLTTSMILYSVFLTVCTAKSITIKFVGDYYKAEVISY